MLGEGGHRASDIHLLEDIPPQQIAGYLAGDGYHGDGIHIAVAMPVIRLVAPGPEVTMHTPTFPLIRA